MAGVLFTGYGLSAGSGLFRVVLPARVLGAPFLLRGSTGKEVARSGGFPVDPSGWVCVVQQPTQGWMVREVGALVDSGRGGAGGAAGVVVSVDDALWALPEGHVHGGAFTREVVDHLRRSVSIADGLVTSTQYLADYFCREGIASRAMTRVVPNGLDMWRYPREPLGLKESVRDGVVRVGFAGGTGHAGLLRRVWSGLTAAVGDVGAELVEVGEPSGLRVPVGVVHRVVPWERDVSVYPMRYSRWLDVGLAVSDSSSFFRAKSPLRLLEYGACGVAAVAVGGTYRPGVVGAPESAEGLYEWNAGLDADWVYERVVELARDEERRRELASGLGAWVREFGTIEARRADWEDVGVMGCVRPGVAA